MTVRNLTSTWDMHCGETLTISSLPDDAELLSLDHDELLYFSDCGRVMFTLDQESDSTLIEQFLSGETDYCPLGLAPYRAFIISDAQSEYRLLCGSMDYPLTRIEIQFLLQMAQSTGPNAIRLER